MDRVVQILADRGCVLAPDAAEHLAHQKDPETHVRRLLPAFLELPFTLTLDQLLAAEATLVVQEPVPAPRPAPQPLPAPARDISTPPKGPEAREFDAEVEILFDASRDEAPAGDIQDFVRYFNDRYDELGRLLRRRREVADAVPIARIPSTAKDAAIIGMVSEKSTGKKSGHRFLTIEDQTGQVTVLAHASRPDLVTLADTLLKDEVVGVVASRSKDGALLMAEAIIRPDLPFRADTREPLAMPVHAAFLGDIHVGSKTFLGDAFSRFVSWMRGETGTDRERALARRIKYLVLPGDIVDGVGVYPGQESGLAIPDVLEQYRVLARELEKLPRHLHLVLLPGNHDASRPTEPQPAFDKEIQGYFDAVDTTFVSNPSTFSLHGRRILGYHGFSMIDFATTVPGMSLERPTEIMRQMLQCRHVAPTYGAKTPIAPDKKDRLLVRIEPDVFVTGHVHVAGFDRYKGVALVNGGTWQSQTDFQKMHNLVPTPALMPTLDLSTLTASRVDFSSP